MNNNSLDEDMSSPPETPGTLFGDDGQLLHDHGVLGGNISLLLDIYIPVHLLTVYDN